MNPNKENQVIFKRGLLLCPRILSTALCLPLLMIVSCSSGDTSTTAVNNVPQTTTSKPVTVASKTLTPIEMGAKVYKKCRTCHTVEDGGRHKVGPNLWAIYGMKAGTKEGFAYSKVMKESGIVWDEATMDGYLENPTKYMPGNRMSFIGLRKKEDRDNLQIYLKDATSP